MKRRWSNILSVVSLVACVLAAMLWIRSECRRDYVGYVWQSGSEPSSVFAGWSEGVVVVRYAVGRSQAHEHVLRGTGFAWMSDDSTGVTVALREQTLGFSYINANAPGIGVVLWGGTLPCWFITGVFALLPAWWVRRFRRERCCRRLGLCVSCGYDLRASRGRCPECGMGIAAKHTAE